MAWIRKLLINSFIVCVSVVLALGAAEFLLHFTRIQYKYLYPLEPGGYLKYDPIIGFDINPNFGTSTHHFFDLSYDVWSNSLGCYDYEYDGHSPYMYFTGDSFTWGFTPLDQKWEKIIEKKTGVRALTCGVNAFGPRQEIIKTSRDLVRLPTPQLIIVGYFGENDVYDDFIFPNFTSYKGYRVPSWTHCDQQVLLDSSTLATSTCPIVPDPEKTFTLVQKIKFELATHSVLYMVATRQFGIQNKLRVLLQKIAPTWGAQNGLIHEVEPDYTADSNDISWSVHLKNLKRFDELAKQYGTQVIFVLIPDKTGVRAPAINPLLSSERIKPFLDAHAIPYIDLLSEFRAQEKLPEHPLYWDFDGHWNIEGNRLAGEIISRYLLEKGFISSSTPL